MASVGGQRSDCDIHSFLLRLQRYIRLCQHRGKGWGRGSPGGGRGGGTGGLGYRRRWGNRASVLHTLPWRCPTGAHSPNRVSAVRGGAIWGSLSKQNIILNVQ